MASFKEHCWDCENKLGKPYEEVHRWLDAFAEQNPTFAHRKMRHHKEGVEEVRAMWGDEAAKAAEIHIKRDFYFWGEVPSKDEMDMVEIAYMNRGNALFHN